MDLHPLTLSFTGDDLFGTSHSVKCLTQCVLVPPIKKHTERPTSITFEGSVMKGGVADHFFGMYLAILFLLHVWLIYSLLSKTTSENHSRIGAHIIRINQHR